MYRKDLFYLGVHFTGSDITAAGNKASALDHKRLALEAQRLWAAELDEVLEAVRSN